MLYQIVIEGLVAPMPTGVYLRFEGGRVSGSSGCNTLTGSAVVGPSTIRFSGLTTTVIPCPSGPSAILSAMLFVLETGAVAYSVDGAGLHLRAGTRELTLRAG
ncbi:hypothetical protein GCM10020369_14930 [Cryptosporangium minutisporangium]|uniref:DUF306 domain-containing protein n=1 Tax=Cryptosporangium minutisporangium TaxID=113569 RepID=A0ABP6SU90_9ACTN